MLNNLTPFSLGFKYIAIILLPEIVTSFVLTYLSKSVGLSSTLIYKLWLRMIMILLPIIPSLPWIITAIINLLLPMIVYFNINHFNTLYDRRERRFREEKYSKSTYILSIITALLILFTLKVFNYFPVAVLSESMNPIFSKGDVIVIEKVNESILDSLKEYDIIYYKKDNKYIIHRIYKIEEKNGKRVITTKGDNNNDIDTWKVYDEEIVGVMKLKFPYIGYPTVWFNELLNN